MKTSKQEAIEKAYGEHWNIVGKHVDEDGYLHHPKGGEVTFEPFIGFMDEHPTKDAYRPKSLSGIETNNGWIRIESEEDLPKEEGEYNIITIKGQHIGTANFTGTEISKQIWLNAYTHFRVIENIKRPIY